MSGDHVLCSDPLVHTVFDKLRRVGHSRTDGQTVRAAGREYGITAHSVCTLQLVHVVTQERTPSNGKGHQRAMVVLEITKNGYHGTDGAAHLLPALMDGLVIKDPVRPAQHSWRVLPAVDVPFQFTPSEAATGDDTAHFQ